MHALRTDRYELAMLGAYLREGLASRRAVFELSLRRLPRNRRFLLVAGIDRIARYLASLRFDPAEIAYLQREPGLRDVMTDELVAYLREFRFRGRLDAMLEGQIAFAGEPIMRVEGTLAEAQILETFLLGVINHETKVASKAARVVLAAAGRPVLEFGARRVDPEAATHAARAAYVAGCVASSCEQAGFEFGVPVSGTCAHSYVLAHVDGGEDDAFQQFAAAFPSGTSLLIDTFDTLRGALRAAAAGPAVRAVRVDSGDLSTLGARVRAVLDAAGRPDVKLVASDEMDEYRIDALVRGGAPYDTFGVGTSIVLCPDAPSLGAVYKLVEVEDRRGVMIPVAKRAPGKASYGGRKQVFRAYAPDGSFARDTVACADEQIDGEALLVPLVRDGAATTPLPTPHDATRAARARAAASLGRLPAAQRVLVQEEAPDAASQYPVEFSAALKRIAVVQG